MIYKKNDSTDHLLFLHIVNIISHGLYIILYHIENQTIDLYMILYYKKRSLAIWSTIYMELSSLALKKLKLIIIF